MNISTFLNLKPLESTKELWSVAGAIESEFNDISCYSADLNKEVTVHKIYENMCEDMYRGASVYSMEYKGIVNCILVGTGRGHTDNETFYVVDKQNYLDMINYLRETFRDEDEINNICYDKDEDISELDFIYGTDMYKELCNLNLDIPHSIGDILTMDITQTDENNEPKLYKDARCKIIDIKPDSINETLKVDFIDFKMANYYAEGRDDSFCYMIEKYNVIKPIFFKWDGMTDVQKEVYTGELKEGMKATFFLGAKSLIKEGIIAKDTVLCAA